MGAHVAAAASSSPAPPPAELKIVPATAPSASVGPARHQRRGRWLIAAIVLLVLAAVAIDVWRAASATPPMHYVTVAVTRGPVTRTVTASGSVNPVITVQVGTYVSGAIQELYCDYNTQVRRGQLC